MGVVPFLRPTAHPQCSFSDRFEGSGFFSGLNKGRFNIKFVALACACECRPRLIRPSNFGSHFAHSNFPPTSHDIGMAAEVQQSLENQLNLIAQLRARSLVRATGRIERPSPLGFHLFRNRGELLKRRLEVIGDFLREHVGLGKVVRVLQALVSQPKDVEADFVPLD